MIQDYDMAMKWFMATAMSHLNRPYLWGGDDPMEGFDCSGFVLECLKAAGKIKEHEDMTADQLMSLCHKNLSGPRRGALCFTIGGTGKAHHVTICLDSCYEIGASGGRSSTISEDRAIEQNAYVKIRPVKVGNYKVFRTWL